MSTENNNESFYGTSGKTPKDYLTNDYKTSAKMDYFSGIVVFGNSGDKSGDTVAIFGNGAFLNDMNPTKRTWKHDSGTWNTHDVESRENTIYRCRTPEGLPVRNHMIEPEKKIMMLKNQFAELIGEDKLRSREPGFRYYPTTDLGRDVLYITMETNTVEWAEMVSAGYIDRKARINVDKLNAKLLLVA
jgi:hypothetical protein